MHAKGTLCYWLAVAAKELREAAGRKQVHIAATMSKDQSSVYRFEKHDVTPRELDLYVAAYAADLDIKPIQIWERALELWRESDEQSTVGELLKAPELPQPGPALRPSRKARRPTDSSRRQPSTGPGDQRRASSGS